MSAQNVATTQFESQRRLHIYSPEQVRSVHLEEGGVALDDGDDATVAAHLRRPGADHTTPHTTAKAHHTEQQKLLASVVESPYYETRRDMPTAFSTLKTVFLSHLYIKNEHFT